MEYYVKFINYTAEIVSRREVLLGLVDFENERTTVYAAGGQVFAQDYSELASAFTILPSVREHIVRRAYTGVIAENGTIDLRFDEARLTISAREEVERVIGKLLNRFRRIASVLKKAEEIGRTIERPPYSEYLAEIEATGFRRMTLHSVARFRNGRLEAHQPFNISGQFSPFKAIEIRVPSQIKLAAAIHEDMPAAEA